MPSRKFFIQRWEQEFSIFLRVFKALPADKLDYRPHPRSRSAAELVWLLVYEEKTGVELIETGKIDWKETPPPRALDDMIKAFEKHHAELSKRLKKVSDKTWEKKKAKLMVEGHLAFETTLGEMFWVALLDAIHHRGQLSTYIRPMGGKVPSIYGPSADDTGG